MAGELIGVTFSHIGEGVFNEDVSTFEGPFANPITDDDVDVECIASLGIEKCR